jgi:hypothetical protein
MRGVFFAFGRGQHDAGAGADKVVNMKMSIRLPPALAASLTI